MKPQDDPPSLKRLEEDIGRFQRKTAPKERTNPQGVGLAMRFGVELVSGVAVGAAIGIMLDRWLGTAPLFLVTCFFLGAAAGGLNLYHAAQAIAKDNKTTSE